MGLLDEDEVTRLIDVEDSDVRLDDLYQRVYPQLVRLAGLLLGDFDSGEDMAQEAFDEYLADPEAGPGQQILALKPQCAWRRVGGRLPPPADQAVKRAEAPAFTSITDPVMCSAPIRNMTASATSLGAIQGTGCTCRDCRIGATSSAVG
jgi:hypothetical protein